MKKTLAEGQFGHGARKINPIRRYLKRKSRLGMATAPLGFVESDIETKIGKIATKNQGQSYSCGRQSAGYWVEIGRRSQGINEGSISAKAGYGNYCAYGGGMTVGALETSIGAYGSVLEVTVPSYDANGNPLSESMFEEISWKTPAIDKDALTRAGYTPVSVPIDIDSISQAIAQYGAVIWEIQGQNGNGDGWLAPYPKPPQKTNSNPLWQHFMCSKGATIINGVKTLVFYNSWGNQIGVGGIQFFTEEYINSGHILDCFSFAYDKNVSPLPSNTSIWADVARYFRRLWSLNN